MAFDGSGNFNRIHNWTSDAAANIKILASRHDAEDNNLATGLTGCITRSGQSPPTADLPMGGFKLINLGAPTNPTDAATKAYADSIRSFNTAIKLSGAVPEARIEFTQSDIGFGARVAGTPAATFDRFVWNDKPDLSGRDLMELTDQGYLQLNGMTDENVPVLVLDTKKSDNAAPIIQLRHTTPSPATNDYCGSLDFYGTNSALANTLYARLLGYIQTPTAAAEDGSLALQVRIGGAFTSIMVADKDGVDIQRNVTNFSSTTNQYIYHAAPHVAYYKKTGANAFYWRKNSTGTVAGTGTVELMSLADSGDLGVAGDVDSGTGIYTGTGTGIVLSPGGASGTVYLRPNGPANGVGQTIVATSGDMTVNGTIFSTDGQIASTTANVYLGTTGAGTVFFRPNGISSGTNQCYIQSSGNLTIAGPIGIKSTGTAWANPSDERIKTVVGDYETGLAEIMQLQPRRFVYKGNDTAYAPGQTPNVAEQSIMAAQVVPYPDSSHYQMAVDGTEIAGFVAQEVEAVMPAMVTQGPGWIDGEAVDDFRTLDTSNLTLALVNACKELATRVEALEAAA